MSHATYWEFIESEAGRINSDGCTGVTGFHRPCCWLHDCEFHHARDAADAYRMYLRGEPDYWKKAKEIDFDTANSHFKRCHFSRSKLGWLSPMGWVRWVFMNPLGKGAWEKHRERERREAEASV